MERDEFAITKLTFCVIGLSITVASILKISTYTKLHVPANYHIGLFTICYIPFILLTLNTIYSFFKFKSKAVNLLYYYLFYYSLLELLHLYLAIWTNDHDYSTDISWIHFLVVIAIITYLNISRSVNKFLTLEGNHPISIKKIWFWFTKMDEK